jgi:hypothetical protein
MEDRVAQEPDNLRYRWNLGTATYNLNKLLAPAGTGRVNSSDTPAIRGVPDMNTTAPPVFATMNTTKTTKATPPRTTPPATKSPGPGVLTLAATIPLAGFAMRRCQRFEQG